jgi:hypothetical protein
MDKFQHADGRQTQTEMPTDLLAGLLMELTSSPKPAGTQPAKLPLKIYCVMAATTLLTFATLTTGYQMLFTHQLFA